MGQGRKIVWALLVFVGLFTNALAQNEDGSRKCIHQKTCIECLDADFACAWCADENYEMLQPRCMPEKNLTAAYCNPNTIETNEKYNRLVTLQNNALRDHDKEELEAVQISPQKISMTVGKSMPQRFQFTYKPARNYPLDLYYLMDLTWSMRDDKETLVGMGGQLPEALAKLTTNYRLGFGSFADKPVAPFIQTEPHRLANPCIMEGGQCEPTYGFRHRLKVTKNVDHFIKQVNDSSITGNVDNLEGGLDALMQVLVCDEQIDWGTNTRKIVILATDGWQHMAGDGLLAGIVERNDKACHLSEDGEYTGTLLYDYPSLEEIWRVLTKTKTAVVFAVTEEQEPYYRKLSELMPELTSVGRLQLDSSNILQLVSKGYHDFVKRVEFTDDAPDYLQIRYTTDCGGMYSSPQPINRCDNVEIGKEYRFNAEVHLLNYPSESVKNLTVRIEETLISNEAVELQINLREMCQCQSEKPQELSAHCNFNGDYSCGACNCYTGHIGKTCECNLQNFQNSRQMDSQCIRPKDRDDLNPPICSDRGECICGECICNPGFTGDHCECIECPLINGQQCGGPTRGICSCEECSCYAGWTGESCDCSTDEMTCTAPQSDQLCSGKGNCICGQCSCHEENYGTYCEKAFGEASKLCTFYEDCVRGAIYKKLGVESHNLNAACAEKVGLYSTQFLDVIDGAMNCTTRMHHQNQTCDFKFSYELMDNRRTLLKIHDIDCSTVNVAWAATWIAFSTFFLGMLIVMSLWLNNYVRDKKLYAQFEREQQEMTMYNEQSPIYKSPIGEFQVPKEMEFSECR